MTTIGRGRPAETLARVLASRLNEFTEHVWLWKRIKRQ
jgi:hypothetical protein